MGSRSEWLQIRIAPAQKAALRRAAAAAGLKVSAYVLARVLPAAQARFADVLRALREAEDRRFALAALNDFLASIAPAEFAEAVERADLRGLPALERNYVAAMVEQAAREKRVEPPAWVRGVSPLDHPYFATPLVGLRPHLLCSAPVPFKRRNLFVDAGVGARV
jgi:uncharacterized protein (DUF1778 family)